MDAEIAKVEANNPELAAELKAARATEIAAATDGTKAQLAAVEKTRKALEKERDKFKADYEGASKGTDEAVKLAQKERDEAKAEAEALTATLSTTKMRHAIERKLGLADDALGKRALKTFLDEYVGGVSLDEDGTVIGLDVAIEKARKAEPDLFARPEAEGSEKKPTGQRAGSFAPPAKPGPKGPKTERQKIDDEKARMRAISDAKKPKKKGT